MSFLLDTSVVIAALTSETHTIAAQDWLEAHRTAALWISEWGLTECSAALSFKLRTGQLSAERQMSARAALTRMVNETVFRVAVTSRQFQRAGELAARAESGLRAGDALHLATASDMGAIMVTLDMGMARAAETLGITCELLTRSP